MFQPDATSEMMKGERCTLEFIRDYTMYAAILGFFSLSWFGWAQEKPRESWRKYLGMASGVSLLVCLIGVYLSVNNWNAPSALSDTSTFQTYLITVYIVFFLAGAGAIVLLLRKRGNYVAPWIAFIVGIHFVGLAPVFHDNGLYILAALIVAISIASLFISRTLNVANSAITGIGTGCSLLIFAVIGLIRYVIAVF